MDYQEFVALPREKKDRLLWELIEWRAAVYQQEATRRDRLNRLINGAHIEAEHAEGAL
jgi:hypothetical protein